MGSSTVSSADQNAAHLISNRRGRRGDTACLPARRGHLDHGVPRLVETVGDVTCEACQRLVLSLYGDRARHLYPVLADRLARDEGEVGRG